MSILRLLLTIVLLAFAAPSFAQSSNAAQDRGVHLNPQREPVADEQQLLTILRDGRLPDGKVTGNVYIPDAKAAVLIQPEGRFWRDFKVTGSRWVHAILFLLAVAAVAALFFFRGGQTYERDPQGRRIKRFRAVDRFAHWLTAVSFVLLALTGLNFVFGRVLVQPLVGDAAFSTMSYWGLVSHNFIGFAFILGILYMTVAWMQDNWFGRVDVEWMKRAGGYFGGEEPPAEKFNAGQKLIYWISVFGGFGIAVTGILMMTAISWLGVTGMQIAQGAHTLIAAGLIAVVIGHAYLGSVGVQGSFDAMSKGDVDLEWARTHHPLWVERVLSGQETLRGGPRRSPHPEPAE
ncbi:MAG TPA: formate dehydrogenase subunit gamma [Beijerinckiaceae bacterium]|jgi:formate dehydrogenase subunit gamma